MKFFLNIIQWWSTLTPTVKLQTLLVVLLSGAVIALYNQVQKKSDSDVNAISQCREELKEEREKNTRLEKEFRNYIINDIHKTDSIQKSVDSLKQ